MFSHKYALSSAQDPPATPSDEVNEIKQLLQNEILLRQSAEDEVNNLKSQLMHWKKLEVCLSQKMKVLDLVW